MTPETSPQASRQNDIPAQLELAVSAELACNDNDSDASPQGHFVNQSGWILS